MTSEKSVVYVFLDLFLCIFDETKYEHQESHHTTALVGGGAPGSGSKICCVILFIYVSENFRDEDASE